MKNKKALLALITLCLAAPLGSSSAMNNKFNNNNMMMNNNNNMMNNNNNNMMMNNNNMNYNMNNMNNMMNNNNNVMKNNFNNNNFNNNNNNFNNMMSNNNYVKRVTDYIENEIEKIKPQNINSKDEIEKILQNEIYLYQRYLVDIEEKVENKEMVISEDLKNKALFLKDCVELKKRFLISRSYYITAEEVYTNLSQKSFNLNDPKWAYELDRQIYKYEQAYKRRKKAMDGIDELIEKILKTQKNL